MAWTVKFGVFLTAVVFLVVDAKYSPAKVVVYSQVPGQFGSENVLICYVSEFHPPDITIDLMKGDEVLKGANQTDLSFSQDWRFHLRKAVAFTPKSGESYKCRVTHIGKSTNYVWETNM